MPEIYPHFLGCSSYWFPSVRLKNVSIEFWWLFWAQAHNQSSQSWKPDPNDSILLPEYTHTIWDWFFIVSHLYGWKMSRSNFDDFFGIGHHRSRESWKRDPNDSVLHSKYTLTFWGVVLIVQCFGQILMTFPCPSTTGAGQVQGKLRNGPEWLGFAPETNPQCLGCSSSCLPSIWLNNVSVEFWWLF